MSLIQSARLNGHDAHAYLKDVLTRLPTQRASEIEECCRINGYHPTLEIIEGNLRELGSDKQSILSARVYIARMADKPVMDEGWW